jgi:hypothetical protein
MLTEKLRSLTSIPIAATSVQIRTWHSLEKEHSDIIELQVGKETKNYEILIKYSNSVK